MIMVGFIYISRQGRQCFSAHPEMMMRRSGSPDKITPLICEKGLSF